MNQTTPLSLGTEKIGKLLKQYAIPAIIAMTASSIYNITDSIFISRGVSSAAFSGLTFTFPLMNLAAAFGSLVGVGASTLLSIRIGQKDYDTAAHILGNVLVLNLIMGTTFGIVALIFLEPILVFFGASPHTLPYAREFMHVILLGNVVTHIYFGLNAMLRSAGEPKKAMAATILTVIINLILNPLFIFGFKWGIQGSAFATIISQVIALAWQFHIFNNKNFIIHWKKGIYRLKKKIVVDSLSIGLSPFLMNAASCLIVVLINRRLTATGGDNAVGAYGVVNRVSFLFLMIVMGINQGMQPIAGYNFGAHIYDRVIAVLKRSIFFATIVMTAGFAIVELFPQVVIMLYKPEQELIDLAIPGLRWVFLFFPLIGFQMVSSAFFQSIGKPTKAILLSLTRQILFLVPFLLIFPSIWGTEGVWISISVSDFLSVILAAVLLTMELKTLKKGTETAI